MKLLGNYGYTAILALSGFLMVLDLLFTGLLPYGSHNVLIILFVLTYIIKKLSSIHEHLSCNLYKGERL